MRHVKCSSCNNEQTPLNNSIGIDGVVLCADCFSSLFKDEKLLKGKNVVRGIDPTICSSCNKDFGDRLLPKRGTFPVCDECNLKISKRILPIWVRAFMGALLIIIMFSFFWNWRFFQAHDEINKSNEAAQQQNYRLAAALMQSASNNVKEVPDLNSLTAYFEGIALLQEDKCEEALGQFAFCKNFLPKDYNVDYLVLQADMGAGFNNKDYPRFLFAAQEMLSRDSTNYMGWASVASAYACLYAEMNKDSLKDLAKLYLNRAMDGVQDTSIAEYLGRIEHRMATKEIITKAEFDKRFPNGWTK